MPETKQNSPCFHRPCILGLEKDLVCLDALWEGQGLAAYWARRNEFPNEIRETDRFLNRSNLEDNENFRFYHKWGKKWKAFKYETNTLWKINLPNQWSRNERTILSTFSFTGVLCSWKTVTGKTSPFLSSWKWLTAKKCPSQKTSVRLRYPTTHLSLTRPNTDPSNSLSLPYKWLAELFCPTDQWEQTAS